MPLEIINCARSYVRAPLLGSLSEATPDARGSVLEFRKALRWFMEKSEWNDFNASICPDQLPEQDCCNLPPQFHFAFHLPEDLIRISAVCIQGSFGRSTTPNTGINLADFSLADYDERTVDEDREEQKKRFYGTDVSYRIIKLDTGKGKKSVLVTDCAPITLEYVCLPGDDEVARLSQAGRDAITYRLSAMLAMIKKADDGDVEKFNKMAMSSLMDAKSLNAVHNQENQELPDGFIVEGRCW